MTAHGIFMAGFIADQCYLYASILTNDSLIIGRMLAAWCECRSIV
jgi:hypothetical protein